MENKEFKYTKSGRNGVRTSVVVGESPMQADGRRVKKYLYPVNYYNWQLSPYNSLVYYAGGFFDRMASTGAPCSDNGNKSVMKDVSYNIYQPSCLVADNITSFGITAYSLLITQSVFLPVFLCGNSRRNLHTGACLSYYAMSAAKNKSTHYKNHITVFGKYTSSDNGFSVTGHTRRLNDRAYRIRCVKNKGNSAGELLAY